MSDAPRLLVLSFAPFPAATGAATRLAQRVTAFADAGYSLDVLTPKTPELPHVSKLMGARILRVPMPTARELPNRFGTIPPGMFTVEDLDGTPSLAARYSAFERAIRRQLSSAEYDVVHTSEPYSGLAVLELKQTARVVYEVQARMPTGDGDTVLGNELRRRDRELVREADVVLAPSEELALRAHGLGASRSAIHVLRPSVDLDMFSPPPDRRRRPSAGLRVALTATVLSSQEVGLLAETIVLLAPTLEVTFDISASVSRQDRQRLVDSDVLAPRVNLTEPVLYEELGPFYQRADVGLVLSSGTERGDVPPVRLQAMAEMMAAGLALIVPDMPAVRELVEDQKQAMLVPAGDAQALAAALRLLLTQPARRRIMGQAARTRAADRLDERRATGRLLSLYGSLLAPSTIEIATAAYMEPSLPNASPLTPSSTTSDSPTRPAVRSPFTNEPSIPSRKAPRPALSTAAEPDAPTSPDMNIHGRVALADLASATATDPNAPAPAKR